MGEQKYVAMVGVDMLHYGKMLTDTADGYTAETPKKIPGLTEAGFNRNGQSGSFYADNVLYDTAVGDGDMDVAIACADVPPELQSELFGYEYKDGVLLGTPLNSPYVFIQYRIQKSSGAYRYVTIFKLKALPKEENVTTKGGSINFQTNGFTLKGAARMQDNAYYRIMDDDDPNLPEGVTAKIIEENWFTDVSWVPGS